MASSRRLYSALLGACLLAPFLLASDPPSPNEDERVLLDSWGVTLESGEETGWTHTRCVEEGEGEELRYRQEFESRDRSLVNGNVKTTRTEAWSLEDCRGVLVQQYSRRESGEEAVLSELIVSGNRAAITTTTLGVSRVREVAWEEGVLGREGERRLWREQGLVPGTTYSYRRFYISLGSVTTETITVLGPEETALLDGRTRLLHHVLQTSDVAPSLECHFWWDDDCRLHKRTLEAGDWTNMWLEATEDRARMSENAELLIDSYEQSIIECDVDVPTLAPAETVLYRLEPKNPSIPLPEELISDPRQEVLGRDDRGVLLRVKVLVPETGHDLRLDHESADLGEFLESNSLIQADHPGLREKAIEVVGSETDAWAAACLLRRFVHTHIDEADSSVGYTSAGRVFESRRGTCSEAAVLLAAMARAIGLPSRVASGLLYVEGGFGPHAWTEVWIGGE